MWQSDRQKCDVIRTLLACVNREDLWTPTGPTKEARHLLHLGGGYLSSGERMILRVAFSIWNGLGEIGDLLDTLDEVRLRAVCEALLARDGAELPAARAGP